VSLNQYVNDNFSSFSMEIAIYMKTNNCSLQTTVENILSRISKPGEKLNNARKSVTKPTDAPGVVHAAISPTNFTEMQNLQIGGVPRANQNY
jgi:hypothetical protein